MGKAVATDAPRSPWAVMVGVIDGNAGAVGTAMPSPRSLARGAGSAVPVPALCARVASGAARAAEVRTGVVVAAAGVGRFTGAAARSVRGKAGVTPARAAMGSRVDGVATAVGSGVKAGFDDTVTSAAP
jgi:hypothetical protein